MRRLSSRNCAHCDLNGCVTVPAIDERDRSEQFRKPGFFRPTAKPQIVVQGNHECRFTMFLPDFFNR